MVVARDGVFDFVVQRDAVCLVRGFLAQRHGRVLKLLINRRPFFRAAKQQPAEVLAKCDLCYTSPCQNGGFCEALPERQFRCKCTPGYHGDRCQHKIDACYGNPCRNSGTCKVLEEGRFRYLPARQPDPAIGTVARRGLDFRVARSVEPVQRSARQLYRIVSRTKLASSFIRVCVSRASALSRSLFFLFARVNYRVTTLLVILGVSGIFLSLFCVSPYVTSRRLRCQFERLIAPRFAVISRWIRLLSRGGSRDWDK